jgi:hypothetical protein
MSREYVPLKVVGVGSAGVGNFVKQGHTIQGRVEILGF